MSSNILSTHSDIAIASDARFRMSGQNRIRYLNSAVLATRTTAQTIGTGTATLVTFDATDVFDTDALHDPASNNSRLTAAIAGKYFVYANIAWDANTTGDRALFIEKETAGTHTNANIVGGSAIRTTSALLPQNNATAIVSLAAGEHVECFCYQDSTGDLDVAGDVVPAFFGMFYIGE